MAIACCILTVLTTPLTIGKVYESRLHAIVWLAFSAVLFVAVGASGQDGQANSPPPQSMPTATSAESDFSLHTPVITIDGLCDKGLHDAAVRSLITGPAEPAATKGTDSECKTVITRQEYEQLLERLGGRTDASHSSRFASQYAEMLLFAVKGREAGVDKESEFEEKLHYDYLQALAQFATLYMQKQADDITDQDVAKYYQQHPGRFVRIHLLQIAVPKHGVQPRGAEETDMRALALKIQKAAATGEKFDKLEEKAYKVAGSSSVPNTDLGTPVPDEIPSEYRKLIFDLEPGQVSQVTEDDHEYLIFKCDWKRTIPETERKHFMGWLRMRDARAALEKSVSIRLNEQYFLRPTSQ